jgi:hypothetical protein
MIFGYLTFHWAHFKRWHARGGLAFPAAPTAKCTRGHTGDEKFPIYLSSLQYVKHLTDPTLPMPSVWWKKGLFYSVDEDSSSTSSSRFHYPSRIAKPLTLFAYGTVSSLLYYPLLFERCSYFGLYSIIAGTASIRQYYTPKQRSHLGWASEPQSRHFKLYPTPCMYWFELVAI